MSAEKEEIQKLKIRQFRSRKFKEIRYYFLKKKDTIKLYTQMCSYLQRKKSVYIEYGDFNKHCKGFNSKFRKCIEFFYHFLFFCYLFLVFIF